jgi:UDP-N-acetylmuramate--alanine ligase
LIPVCKDLLKPNDVIVLMGAGNIWKLGQTILEKSI